MTVVARAFQYPTGLVLGPDGSLYCLDRLAGQVLRVTPEGQVLWLAQTGGRPRAAAFAPDGCLYVADEARQEILAVPVTGTAGVPRVRAHWGETGEPPRPEPLPFTGEDDEGRTLSFAGPRALAVTPTGSVWVGDGGAAAAGSLVYRFAADGALLDRWHGVEGLQGLLWEPQGHCLLLTRSGRILRLTPRAGGRPGVMETVCQLPEPQEPHGFYTSLAAAAAGQLLVAEAWAGRCLCLGPDGELRQGISLEAPHPTSLLVADRWLHYAELETGSIYRQSWPGSS